MNKNQIIISEFNDYINKGDLEGLASFMTDDHIFIDTGNNVVNGKEKALDAWKVFFEYFPDYRNHFDSFFEFGDRISVLGYSTCSDKRLEGAGIWRIKIIDNKISEWRVLEDTRENRLSLQLPKANS